MKIRKVISFILMSILVFNCVNIVKPTRSLASEKTIDVNVDNNGQYIKSKNSKTSLKAQLVQGEVYSLENNILILQVSDNGYQVVQRKFQTYISPNYDWPAPIAVQWAGIGWVENGLSISFGNTEYIY